MFPAAYSSFLMRCERYIFWLKCSLWRSKCYLNCLRYFTRKERVCKLRMSQFSHNFNFRNPKILIKYSNLSIFDWFCSIGFSSFSGIDSLNSHVIFWQKNAKMVFCRFYQTQQRPYMVSIVQRSLHVLGFSDCWFIIYPARSVVSKFWISITWAGPFFQNPGPTKLGPT